MRPLWKPQHHRHFPQRGAGLFNLKHARLALFKTAESLLKDSDVPTSRGERAKILRNVAAIVRKALETEEASKMTAKEPHERTLTIEQPLDPKIRKLLKRGQKKRKAHRSTLSSFFKTLIDHDQGQHRAKADLFEILVLLAKTGSQTQESLAGRHGVKSEDLSEIISVMRRMGLVTASCKQEQVELTLTPRGKEITSSYLSDGAAY